MAYRIELGQDLSEGLYLELAIRNKNTGGYVCGDNVEHQLVTFGWGKDYGRPGRLGQVVASNSNGMITSPEPGILCIAVPTPILLFGGVPLCGALPPTLPALPDPPLGGGPAPPNYGVPIPPPYAPFFDCDIRRSLHFKLLATPLIPQPPTVVQPDDLSPDFSPDFGSSLPPTIVPTPPIFAALFTKTLAKGTISFGGNMPNPRLTLMVYPLYPNSPTASVVSCQVAEMKQILAQQGTYDKVEQGLSGPTDPATISWTTGGTMSLGGPLANKISAILGPQPGMPIDLTSLIMLAANLPT